MVNNMSDIMIPQALQIVVDDLGWFCGDDDRKSGGASRTGMPRHHGYKDYEAIHELGKALNQKILCGFCLAEWDPDNRMRTIPYLSKYGDDWNNAAYYDARIAAECEHDIRRFEIVHTKEVITMEDDPICVVRAKKESSALTRHFPFPHISRIISSKSSVSL